MSGDLESRSAESSPFGKCDERIDIPVPAELKERIAAASVIRGVNSTEYIRHLLYLHFYGEIEVMRRTMNRPF